MTDDDLFATPPHTLHRIGAVDTSVEAAHAVDATALERLVLAYVRSCGTTGCIQDDVLAAYPHKPYSSITARFRTLLDAKTIVDTGVRRKGRSGRNQRVVCAGAKP